MSDPSDRLPSINLEFLRKSAKALLRACRAGDASAIARVRVQLPHLSTLDADAIAARVKLADVQHALAREGGALNWAELKRRGAPVERFLVAIRGAASTEARRLLAESAPFARDSIHVACAVGDLAAATRLLDRDLRLATAEHSGWPPLVYACASPLHRVSDRHSSGIFECVQLLLDRGVDPNTYTLSDPRDPESRVPAAARAFRFLNMPVMMLLGQRGANSRVSGSGLAEVMSGAEHFHREVGMLLRKPAIGEEFRRMQQAFWAQYGETASLHHHPADLRELHRERPRGVPDLVNELWCDTMGTGYEAGRIRAAGLTLHAVARTGTAVLAELLLDEGADPDEPLSDGHNALVVAIRSGNKPVAEVLRAQGASASGLRLVDRLLGACRRLDADEAKDIVARHPDIASRMLAEDTEVIVQAAAANRLDEVRLMAESGLNLDAAGESGATPLHLACWHGHLAMVRLLLDHGARATILDTTFGGTPLAWALDGSEHCRDADDDYCAVATALMDAGVDPMSVVRSDGALTGSARVRELLRARGPRGRWRMAGP